MRYKKDQDKAFFNILEAYKTVKPAEKATVGVPAGIATPAVKGGKESKDGQRQPSVQQIRQ